MIYGDVHAPNWILFGFMGITILGCHAARLMWHRAQKNKHADTLEM